MRWRPRLFHGLFGSAPHGIALAVALGASVAVGFMVYAARQKPTSPEPSAPIAGHEAALLPATAPPQAAGHPAGVAGANVLIVGGGPLPEANEVSIEGDVLLARELAGEGAEVLFAGGAEGRSVQVLDPSPRGDPLLAELADLLAPRAGRGASYRAPRAPAAGAARRENVEQALARLLASGTGAVTLVLHGHGERGERPSDGAFALWGRSSLTPRGLDAALDGTTRPLRVISSACFSGSFAELVFAGADESQGPAAGLRCGLFAAPWDLESTGCDPDPESTLRDGFGVHFWNALRRRSASGAPLAPAEVDFDGDGHVSFLEAHARVRIAAVSADVPTTTHERWLRAVVPEGAADAEAPGPSPLPEDDAVIAALSARLPAGLGELARATQALDEAEATAADAAADLADARAVTDDAWSDLAGGLLARWPTLDDPWHPDHAADLAAARPGLADWLHNSPAALKYNAALETERRLDDFGHGLRASAAPLERLQRALLNVHLARQLITRGGPALTRWREILSCERGTLGPG